MNTNTSVVRSHERKRRDRVGEALKAASSLRNPRTVHDWMIEYSRNQYDPNGGKDQILWHLDPVALRSAVTQAQQRLHVPSAQVITTTGEIIFKAHAGGDFTSLLGTKLFPSAPAAGKKRTGKTPRWCAGIAEIADTEKTPDGLQTPEIQLLIAAAMGAGDTAFANSEYLKRIARASVATRAREIEQNRNHFKTRALQRAQIQQTEHRLAAAEAERDQARLERDEANRKLNLLDWDKLAAAGLTIKEVEAAEAA